MFIINNMTIATNGFQVFTAIQTDRQTYEDRQINFVGKIKTQLADSRVTLPPTKDEQLA